MGMTRRCKRMINPKPRVEMGEHRETSLCRVVTKRRLAQIRSEEYRYYFRIASVRTVAGEISIRSMQLIKESFQMDYIELS